MKIQFKDVGREKATWVAEIKELTESALIRAIKKKDVLRSSGIDVTGDESGGIILVGGFRTVGTWSVIKETEAISLAV